MSDVSSQLGKLMEEFIGEIHAGRHPEIEEYAQRHLPLAERIRALFPTLLFLEGVTAVNVAAAGRGRPRNENQDETIQSNCIKYGYMLYITYVTENYYIIGS